MREILFDYEILFTIVSLLILAVYTIVKPAEKISEQTRKIVSNPIFFMVTLITLFGLIVVNDIVHPSTMMVMLLYVCFGYSCIEIQRQIDKGLRRG